ncbi:uncharacterized protein LOC119274643 [Triticum dicoccoides]|uniref:uncharacterized protein LOC119274643 n=1 Tax=Triticum dicoccoides TaxID=85692 RepID=UPI00188FF8EB|nr:uncharacterized protein LOC119274643 [Triticum dicoccoides]
MAHRPTQRKRQRKKLAKLNRKLRAEQLRAEHLRAEQRRLVATPSLKLCFLMLVGWVWRSKYEVESGKRHGQPTRRRQHRKWRAVQTVSDRPVMSSFLFPLIILLLMLLVLARFVPPEWLPKFMAWLLPWMSSILPVAVLVPMFLHFLSGWPMEQAQLLLIAIWPQWALTLLLSEEKSLEDYVRANAVTVEYKLSANEDKDAVLLSTKVGMDLWSGFIEVIIKAYRCNKSWGGGFSSEDLRMSGHRCRISLNPTFPASFPNLLSDFAKLAHLLIYVFKASLRRRLGDA